jgi:very-short-patch-repair endonuclease
MHYRPEIVTAAYRATGLPDPVYEHRFDPVRKWRFDLAWPRYKVALEVDGGIWTRGRHARGSGIAGDHEKNNAALLAGWALFRCQPREVCLLATMAMLRQAMSQREGRA